jgi:hypothetical protein
MGTNFQFWTQKLASLKHELTLIIIIIIIYFLKSASYRSLDALYSIKMRSKAHMVEKHEVKDG